LLAADAPQLGEVDSVARQNPCMARDA
jgi:hypothetical protein